MINKETKERLRQAWATAVLDCLAQRCGYPSIATDGAGRAVAREIGSYPSEVSRARHAMAVQALAVWAAEQGIAVMQTAEGEVFAIDTQPKHPNLAKTANATLAAIQAPKDAT